MMNRVRVCLFALLGALSLPLPSAAEKVEALQPRGYVNDFAGVFNDPTKDQLSSLCAELDRKTRAQIAIVTIRSLEGLTEAEFTHRLLTRWGVGYKGDNRGLLILLAIKERKYRIEVGYGLEPILPDGKVGAFGREMVPLLRQGDYNAAVLHLTSRLAQVIAQDRGVTLSGKPPRRPPPQGLPPLRLPGERRPITEQEWFWWLVLILDVPFALLLVWLLKRAGGIPTGRGDGGFWGGFGGGGGGLGGGGGGGGGGFGGGGGGGGGAGGGW